MPSNADEIDSAIRLLAAGGLVAFPTETVWGIAADARQRDAVERLRRFKGRDPAQPISLLIAEPDELAALDCEVDARAMALIEAFWPGPVTLVLPLAPTSAFAPLANTGGGLGIRCSPHPVARELALRAARAGVGPLTATSCNLCGDLAAETRAEARAVCSGDGETPFLLEAGEDAPGGLASTVVDLCATPARILRDGAVAPAAIEQALARVAKVEGEPGTGSRP